MPVRSLTSSVLKWPDADTVRQSAAHWADELVREHPEVRRVGYFGSYARGDWGVGSDLDLVLIVDRSDEPFARRGAVWDVGQLPVPADLLVYTADEWASLLERGGFGKVVAREAVWLYTRHEGPNGEKAE